MPPGVGSWPYRSAPHNCFLTALSWGMPYPTEPGVFHPFTQDGGNVTLETHQSLDPLPCQCGGETSSVLGLVPTSDMVNSKSMVSIKLGDSFLVIGF